MFYFLLYTFDFILTSLEMGINFVNKQNISKLKKLWLMGKGIGSFREIKNRFFFIKQTIFSIKYFLKTIVLSLNSRFFLAKFQNNCFLFNKQFYWTNNFIEQTILLKARFNGIIVKLENNKMGRWKTMEERIKKRCTSPCLDLRNGFFFIFKLRHNWHWL